MWVTILTSCSILFCDLVFTLKDQWQPSQEQILGNFFDTFKNILFRRFKFGMWIYIAKAVGIYCLVASAFH